MLKTLNNKRSILGSLFVVLSCSLATYAYCADITDGMSAQQISAIIPTLKGHDRMLALLHLARLDSQKSDASPTEVAAGIQYYQEAIDTDEISLETLTARIQLAGLFLRTGKVEEAKTLLNGVIHADVKPVVDNGVSPLRMARIKGLSSREIARGVDVNSPEHVAASNKLLESAQQDIIKKYFDVRHAALEMWAEQIYRESGKLGVAKYAESLRDDNDAKVYLQSFLSRETVQ